MGIWDPSVLVGDLLAFLTHSAVSSVWYITCSLQESSRTFGVLLYTCFINADATIDITPGAHLASCFESEILPALLPFFIR